MKSLYICKCGKICIMKFLFTLIQNMCIQRTKQAHRAKKQSHVANVEVRVNLGKRKVREASCPNSRSSKINPKF